MKTMGEKKVYFPESIEDIELPEAVLWEDILDAPQSLAELDQESKTELETATTAITGLGDLAYEDLVTELELADEAVTNAKIAVDAIQGDVIAASAITEVKIGSNAISAGKIQSSAITAGKIATGAVTATKIDAGAVTADKINAGAVTAGKIAAGAIDGITITGSLIRTSSSGGRVELDDDDDSINIYDTGGDLRARGYDQGWEYYNESGTLVGELYASNTDGFLVAADLTSSGKLYYGVGSSGTHSFHVGTSGSTLRLYIDDNDIFIGDTDNLDMDIEMLGLVEFHNEKGFITPTVGRVSSGGSLSGGGVGWSASRTSTGVYEVDHGLGSSAYSVVATVEESSGIYDIKIGSRGSNDFTVRINDETDTLVNADFNFILIFY